MAGREGMADRDGFAVEDAEILAEAVGALRMAGIGRGGKVAVTVELSELEALALRFRARQAFQHDNRVLVALGGEARPLPETDALQGQVQAIVSERAGRELDSLLARLLDAARSDK